MAIAIPFNPFNNGSPVERKRPPAIQPEPGSLVVIDQFSSSPDFEQHGDTALRAARQHGFRGPTQKVSLGSELEYRRSEGKTSGPSAFHQEALIAQELATAGLKPERVRHLLTQEALIEQVSLLDEAGAELQQLKQSGLKNSAVNLSYGTSPQRIAQSQYHEVMDHSLSALHFNHRNRNVMAALGVTSEKLNHPDPNIHGPERAKLQQGLIDVAEASSDHPQLQQAKQRYRKDVQALEAQHNSVVVSSGNQEQVADKLAQEANGIRPRIDASKNVNVLVNSEVTTVGATRWWIKDGQLSERLAGYSNRSSQVDLYASGSVPDRNQPFGPPVKGTSFAAPRVAGAMAALHHQYPHLSSRQIESMLKQSLTHETQGETVLNFDKTFTYLQDQTF